MQQRAFIGVPVPIPPAPPTTLPTPQTAFPSKNFAPPRPAGSPGFGTASSVQQNWSIQFRDAEGIPLNMQSFEQIDFGAISYKEIFQNVKTILATPLFSAALERTLGIDQDIVDLPMNRATEATVAFLQALYFWEPRVEVVSIDFQSDVISGHLIVNLSLKINNVIFGTDTAYAQANVFPSPDRVTEGLPPVGLPVIETGPPGAQGQRGSRWGAGTLPPLLPDTIPPGLLLPGDMYLDTTTGDVSEFQE